MPGSSVCVRSREALHTFVRQDSVSVHSTGSCKATATSRVAVFTSQAVRASRSRLGLCPFKSALNRALTARSND